VRGFFFSFGCWLTSGTVDVIFLPFCQDDWSTVEEEVEKKEDRQQY
jgi:hypothetical protein